MITRVQFKSNNTGAVSGMTSSIILDAAPQAGNLLVVAVACVSSGGAALIVYPGLPITWMWSTLSGSNQTNLLLAVGRVFAGASAQIDFSTNANGGICMAVAEYHSDALGLRVDRYAQNSSTGSTTPSAGPTGTTSSANEVWIGAVSHRFTGGATFSAPTGGFSILAQQSTSIGANNDRSLCFMEQAVSSVGTATPGCTVSNSGSWTAMALTIEEMVSGGGGSTFQPMLVNSGNLIV